MYDMVLNVGIKCFDFFAVNFLKFISDYSKIILVLNLNFFLMSNTGILLLFFENLYIRF